MMPTPLSPTEANDLRFNSAAAYLTANITIVLGSPSTAVNNCMPTATDGQGPYYLQSAEADTSRFPERSTVCVADPVCTSCSAHPGYSGGIPLFLYGQVLSSDTCQPIAGDSVKVEIWQADPAGNYWQAEDIWSGRRLSTAAEHHYNCRAMQRGSHIEFHTYLPGQYVSFAPNYRARHLHVKVTEPSHTAVVTQFYIPGDEVLSFDVDDAACPICASRDPDRLLNLTLNGAQFTMCDLPAQAGVTDRCIAGCPGCHGQSAWGESSLPEPETPSMGGGGSNDASMGGGGSNDATLQIVLGVAGGIGAIALLAAGAFLTLRKPQRAGTRTKG